MCCNERLVSIRFQVVPDARCTGQVDAGFGDDAAHSASLYPVAGIKA